jgi:hypothetical protein
MAKSLPDTTPQLNRLRAAAGLIPIIEDGLTKGTLTPDRASLMAAFCEWAHSQSCEDADTQSLAKTISDGLERIELKISNCQKQAA